MMYLLKRKNEFGIHSPFVYDFYRKYLKGNDEKVLDALGLTETVDVRVEELLKKYLLQRSEHVVFMTKEMHKNRINEAAWEAVCEHPEVVLTLDLYDKGFVFYRKGMEKQNFILK